jgi:hypothetical protein
MPKIPELDLHKYRPSDPLFIEKDIMNLLDRFLTPFLVKPKGIELRIVVGKGLRSSRSIQGKNPLRFYVENYLNQLGLNYRDAGYHDGQEGVIVVSL